MKKANKILIGLIFALGLIFIAAAAFAQDQDVNPYGGIYYNDHANQRFYGRFALPRTDNTNLDTLTNLIKGSLVFDTLENQLEYVDTNFNWIGVNEGNTLDEAYDQGGAGSGRTITADAGAVEIDGNLIITDSVGIGTSTPDHDINIVGSYENTYDFLTESGGKIVSIVEVDDSLFNDFGGITRGIAMSSTLGERFQSYITAGDIRNVSGGFLADSAASVLGSHDITREGANFADLITGWKSKIPFIRGYVADTLTPGQIRVFGVDYYNGMTFGSIGSNYLQVNDTETGIYNTLKYEDGNEADGYVLTSDADGNATWTHTFSYGEMGFGDSTSTIALTLNTPAWVTNGNNDLWSEGATTLEGITYSNDSLICNADGVHEVNLRISGDLALNDVLKVGVYKNGSLSCTCQAQITSPLAGTVEITYVDILPLSAGDVLQVYITNTANSNDFDAISAKMTMHKVGN